ncbi:MAG: acyl-CoA dehydrogenase family protein [Acidimicrobiia bacterium]
MDLDFTAEQDELRAGIRAVLEKESPPTLARAIVEHTGDAAPLWHQMVELGWPALTVPESAGGLGLGAIELAVLCEELGRAITPGPLLSTVAGFIPMVRECGTEAQIARFLEPVANGERAGALAWFGGAGAVTLTTAGDCYTLSGSHQWVLDGSIADDIAVIAHIDGSDAVAVVVVPRDACTVTPIQPFDASRAVATVAFDNVTISADAMLANANATTVARALEEFTVAVACEMVGTAQQIFDIILAYAKERHQFGVPIGSFQAIKHKFADLAVLLERARACAYFAALTIAEDSPQRAVAASVAKAAAGDLADRADKEGIQVLGGIGYTWEHDMHLHVRRLTTDALLLGDSADHRARIADTLFS